MSSLPQHCDHRPASIKNNHPRVHNLDIRQYSLDEIYALFGVRRDTLSIEDLKKSKHRVLMTHPDKSGMPPDYFIFYKKALEVIATDYAEMHRVEQSNNRMTELEKNNYEYSHGGGEEEERMRSVIGKSAEGDKFQRDFNRIFEEQMQQKIDESRNDWFRDDRAAYDTSRMKSGNAQGMAQNMEEIKRQQRAVARYTGGVREMTHHIGTRLYDNGNGTGSGEEDGEDVYISGDPFAKLKFEDLRRVHKDETVFQVSESDYNNQKTYKNVEEYGRARSSQHFDQISKEQAERILQQREQERAQRIQQYQRQAYEQGLANEKKQEAVKAMFLRLAN
jgi:hypothetical protein